MTHHICFPQGWFWFYEVPDPYQEKPAYGYLKEIEHYSTSYAGEGFLAVGDASPRASGTASSAAAKSAPRWPRIPITVGVRVRSRASSTVRHSVMVGGAARDGRTSSHSWIGFPPAPGAADSPPASSSARS
jgi:hypothetical protein